MLSFERIGKGKTVVLETMPQNSDLYAEWDDGDSEGDRDIDVQYEKYIFRKVLFFIGSLVAIFLVAGYVVTYGQMNTSMSEAYSIIWNHILGKVPGISDDDFLVDDAVWNQRMPRITVAIISGFALAVAGAVMQSTLKNPMADSYTTGVSSGAAFGATVSLVAGFIIISGPYGVVLNAFIFSLVPTFIIVLISKVRAISATSMILAGMAIMYIFNACTSVLKLWSDPEALASLYRWQVGSLTNMQWSNVPIMLAVTIAGTILLIVLSSKINILTSGDESAKSLGIDAQKLRVICLVTASLMTAAVVSFTGTIGFVGLVCPHIARIFIGSDNRYLIPAAGAFGALLMLVADYIGRVVIAPSILEVGVVTAFIGGPMFLYLIVRQKKEVW